MAGMKAAPMPSLIYGTAWKKDATRALVKLAILSGFRGIDTAAQPKHYQEPLVGAGIRDAISKGNVKREELYIQTKFTSINGQDPRKIPYDPNASITEQVKASVASSLHNLGSPSTVSGGQSYIDCLVLHSPFPVRKQTEEAWRAMEAHVPHSVRSLGISNIYHLPALQALYNFATIKPVVVQNRFYRDTGYDTALRAFCSGKGITYQSFWTLSANPHLLHSPAVKAISENAHVSPPVALYSLVLALGKMSVLNGTTNPNHMRDDLEGVRRVAVLAESHHEDWKKIQEAFEGLLEL